MDKHDNDQQLTQLNETILHRTSSTRIPYLATRRPAAINMEDHSPATRSQLTKEYFDEYDPWMGIRIAATIGTLVSCFTLYLIYKSRVNRNKTSHLPPKKTSLYLYEEESGSISSSCRSSMLRMEFPNKNIVMDRTGFNFENAFQLEEVLVKPSAGDRVVFKVHPSLEKGSKNGLKFGTLQITEDSPKYSRCCPYKSQGQASQDVKTIPLITSSMRSAPLTDDVKSFGVLNTCKMAKKYENQEKSEKATVRNGKKSLNTKKLCENSSQLSLDKTKS